MRLLRVGVTWSIGNVAIADEGTNPITNPRKDKINRQDALLERIVIPTQRHTPALRAPVLHQITQSVLDRGAADSFCWYVALGKETYASQYCFYAEYVIAVVVNVGWGNVVTDSAQKVLDEIVNLRWELKSVGNTLCGTTAVDAESGDGKRECV